MNWPQELTSEEMQLRVKEWELVGYRSWAYSKDVEPVDITKLSERSYLNVGGPPRGMLLAIYRLEDGVWELVYQFDE